MLTSSMHLNHIRRRHQVNLLVKEKPRCRFASSGDEKLMNNHCHHNICYQKVQTGSEAALLHTHVDGVCGLQLLDFN